MRIGLVGTGGENMTIQRIGSTEGLKDVFGVKVLPVISLAVVHNGIVSTCGVTAEPTGDVKVQTTKVLATYGWRICGTSKNTIPSGTNGLTEKILRYAPAFKLHSGGQIYWLKSW